MYCRRVYDIAEIVTEKAKHDKRDDDEKYEFYEATPALFWILHGNSIALRKHKAQTTQIPDKTQTYSKHKPDLLKFVWFFYPVFL